MTRITWLGALSLASLFLTQSSCQVLECGTGTVEKNGMCVVADGARPDNTTYCGDGTHYDDNSGGCISDLPPTVCDPTTSSEVPGPDGVITCVGTGGGGCNLGCPAADAGKVTVCGVLKDAETDVDIGDGGSGDMCDPKNPTTSGPCSLQLEFYDALAFAQNPTGTNPLAAEITVNDCGHYVAKNITRPNSGYLAIGVDDYDNTNNDNFVLSGVALPADSGGRYDDQVTYAVKNTSDQKWTMQAYGNTNTLFSQMGAYMPIFLHMGTPVEGVVVTANSSPVSSSDDFYFDDTSATSRASINPSQSSTGPNGSAITINQQLVNHSGQGGSIGSCMWADALAAAIPGVYFVQVKQTVDTNGDTCQ